MGFTKLLQSLQNLAMRKILGVFKTAPILPMEVESALPPPEIRLNSKRRMYAFRMLKLSPNHPINAATDRIINPHEVPPRKRNQKPLQLQTIYESIKYLYQKVDLETIQHHYFAPWEKNTPYEVIISKLSKEEETEEHLKTVSQKPANSILIYTDASSNATKESVGVGIGIIVKTPPSPSTHYEKKKNIGTEQLVYNGELEGATMAVEYTARKARPGLNFHIFSDNQAGLWRLKPHQTTQARTAKLEQSKLPEKRS